MQIADFRALDSPQRCGEVHATKIKLSITMQCDGEYLKEGPRSLLKSCDIVLQLDDGAELPAHSQVLARCSGVFSDMLDGGPLSSTSPGHRITLPFSDCSKEEAVRFLSPVYSSKPDKHIDEASALSIAKLGHKYGTQV